MNNIDKKVIKKNNEKRPICLSHLVYTVTFLFKQNFIFQQPILLSYHSIVSLFGLCLKLCSANGAHVHIPCLTGGACNHLVKLLSFRAKNIIF